MGKGDGETVSLSALPTRRQSPMPPSTIRLTVPLSSKPPSSEHPPIIPLASPISPTPPPIPSNPCHVHTLPNLISPNYPPLKYRNSALSTLPPHKNPHPNTKSLSPMSVVAPNTQTTEESRKIFDKYCGSCPEDQGVDESSPIAPGGSGDKRCSRFVGFKRIQC